MALHGWIAPQHRQSRPSHTHILTRCISNLLINLILAPTLRNIPLLSIKLDIIISSTLLGPMRLVAQLVIIVVILVSVKFTQARPGPAEPFAAEVVGGESAVQVVGVREVVVFAAGWEASCLGGVFDAADVGEDKGCIDWVMCRQYTSFIAMCLR